MVFSSFFYHLRKHGLKVSLNEWLALISALDCGLADSSLIEFYYLSRAILVHSEADFDQFDVAFLSYFEGLKPESRISDELLEYLSRPIQQQDYDQAEVDVRTKLNYEELRQLLNRRLHEQVGAHNGGKRWIGTGGTSPLGNSGYSYTGLRVGGTSEQRRALQIASERSFRDFREDETFDLRQFQTAFRRLRQLSLHQNAAKTELDLDTTIDQTCKNGGRLQLAFQAPRKNTLKLLLLFDSGGSMEPYAQLCNHLFQAVSKANHFSKLDIYYFHNCPYNRIYKTPACIYSESIDTQWLLDRFSADYRVIFVGDASMATWEMRYYAGGRSARPTDQISGLAWLHRFVEKYERSIWLNPIPKNLWETTQGRESIARIRQEVPMYQLSLSGLEEGIHHLIAAR